MRVVVVRVTELCVRPLVNIFYPELSGFIQPLSGEYAGRRSCLEKIPFFSGYGVEIGHLIDIVHKFQLDSVAQVNLGVRIHRNRDLSSLSKMSFSLVQVILKRLQEQNKLTAANSLNSTFLTFPLNNSSLEFEVTSNTDIERQPMASYQEYNAIHSNNKK